MLPIPCCKTCGCNLGPILGLYYTLKTRLLIEKRAKHEDLGGIRFANLFDQMGLSNGCCFAQIHGIQLLPDFGYGIGYKFSGHSEVVIDG